MSLKQKEAADYELQINCHPSTAPTLRDGQDGSQGIQDWLKVIWASSGSWGMVRNQLHGLLRGSWAKVPLMAAQEMTAASRPTHPCRRPPGTLRWTEGHDPRTTQLVPCSRCTSNNNPARY